MKKCRTCKNVFPDTFKYCNKCGSKAPAFSSPSSVIGSVLKALAFFLFFNAVQTAVVFGFVIIRLFAEGLPDSFESARRLMNDVISQSSLVSIVSGVLSVVLLFIFFTVRKKSFAKEIGLKKFAFGTIPVIIVLGIAINFFTSITLSVIPIPEKLMQLYDMEYSFLGMGDRIIEFAAVVIVAPVVEEIIFRGLMFSTLRKRAPLWFAASVTAVIFGIAHLNPISFVYTALLGFLLAYLCEQTGSVAVPALLHVGFNFGTYFVGLLPEDSPLLLAVTLVVSAIASVACTAVVIISHRKS